MSMFKSLYQAESRRGERSAYIFRWIMILFLGAMAVIQTLDPIQRASFDGVSDGLSDFRVFEE
ncbi:MAG: hypothetical protein ABIJ86_05615 [Spirochaetota bacterium]